MRPLLAMAATFMLLVSACVDPTEETAMQQAIDALSSDPSAFTLVIEAAGVASIDEARATPTGLDIDYRYTATDGSAEQRVGSLQLTTSASNTAEGQWRTEADNGSVYAGALGFEFSADGTATGTYDFAGTTYQITITKA